MGNIETCYSFVENIQFLCIKSTASTAPNAPQFDAEKAKVGERNLILVHNSLKEICFLTFLKVWIVNILGGAPFRLTCTLCKGCR